MAASTRAQLSFSFRCATSYLFAAARLATSERSPALLTATAQVPEGVPSATVKYRTSTPSAVAWVFMLFANSSSPTAPM